MWCSVFSVYTWIGFTVEILLSFLFDAMIELEPEGFSQRVLLILCIVSGLIVGIPTYIVFTTGFVSPQVQFFTGIKGTDSVNPHVIFVLTTVCICSTTALVSYLYGKYHLNKYHKISIEFESDSTKNMIKMKTVLIAILISGSNGVLAVSLPTLKKQKTPVSVIIAATIITLSLVKFSRTPKVKEFLARKSTQKMTTITESVKAFRFKRKTNRVGIQNTPEPEEISSEF
ncbi:uncharacterized protein LOC111708164 isoform X2 [Eurytemora carolleeae]|uniref:uncharacterized protein LOC111708164 isoform X2 n=1 Tax=Eurytemora carolleeae TaxID=1294199 RepID=UPI000C775B4A|nr:uncharacterized protein LOC111708164 isoform X2 [Eurytemora carolleeae]|eukprot:XP_023337226.1 uncharacterized protein LOC111708164 isoform X2 [Eurytemora affinis]